MYQPFFFIITLIMKLYYGADKLVKEPKYNYGNPSNDYGLGFYLTPDKEIAKLWASKNPSGGYLITYEVELGKLDVMRLEDSSEESVLVWISMLVSHRFSREEREKSKDTIKWLENNYAFQAEEHDVIIGYRADDSYFDYSKEFVNNNLSLEVLKEAMVLGKLGLQYVLKSEAAFKKIKYIEHEKVPFSNDYENFRKITKDEYLKLKKEDKITNTFIRDIMRKRGEQK